MTDGGATDKLGNTIGLKLHESSAVLEDNSHRLSINDLPPELLVQIFAYLDVKQVVSLRTVCRRWNAALMDRDCWEMIFSRKFGIRGGFPLVTSSGSYVEEYFTRTETMKKWRNSNLRNTHYTIDVGSSAGFPMGLLDTKYADKVLADFSVNRYLVLMNGVFNRCKLADGHHLFTQRFGDYYEEFCLTWRYFAFTADYSLVFVRDLKLGARSATELIKHGQLESMLTSLAVNETVNPKLPWVVAVGTEKGALSFWTLEGEKVHECQLQGKIRRLAFKKNSQYLYVVTDSSVCLYDVQINAVVKKVEIDIDITPVDRTHLHEDPLGASIGFDVDWDGRNVILFKHRSIRVVDFLNIENPRIRLREIEVGNTLPKRRILLGKLQAHVAKGRMYDRNRLGGDGLYYANVLNDLTVVVWNVRDKSSSIEWQCEIKESQRMWNLQNSTTSRLIFGIDLNSLVVVIGLGDGNTLVYSALTGKYIGQSTVTPPKKVYERIPDVFPDIQLNPIQTEAEGIVMFRGFVERFRYEIKKRSNKAGRKVYTRTHLKSYNLVGTGYAKNPMNVRFALNDYEEYQTERANDSHRIHEYNGDFLDGENEVSLALAIKESTDLLDEDTEIALRASLQDQGGHPGMEDEVMDEELMRVIQLSLTDQ